MDEKLKSGGGASYVEKAAPQGSPSKLIGLVVFWVIMLFVISSAIGTLGIPALTGFMNQVLGYLPNVSTAPWATPRPGRSSAPWSRRSSWVSRSS